jgi:hypothetical protein
MTNLTLPPADSTLFAKFFIALGFWFNRTRNVLSSACAIAGNTNNTNDATVSFNFLI